MSFQRWVEQKNYNAHRDRLRNMQPSIDTSAPRSIKRMNRRNIKREMLEHERAETIKLDNKLLVEAMVNIKDKSVADRERKHVARVARQMTKFHQQARDFKNKKISDENKVILDRLIKSSMHSQYSKDSMKIHEKPLSKFIAAPDFAKEESKQRRADMKKKKLKKIKGVKPPSLSSSSTADRLVVALPAVSTPEMNTTSSGFINMQGSKLVDEGEQNGLKIKVYDAANVY